jgi:peptide subunit release factor 1 (eRF1)
MGSEWAKEAERQAEAMTRDLAEVGKGRGFRVTYQKREARFALKAGTTMTYFSAHDYETPRGMD